MRELWFVLSLGIIEYWPVINTCLLLVNTCLLWHLIHERME